MCLIIHKPAEVRIPEELISAAAVHNPDGWGVMGFAADGRTFVEKRAQVHVAEIADLLWQHRDAELALHLRRQTRGAGDLDNAHPFAFGDGLWLMHNGTLPLAPRVPGRSDSWHLAHDLLRPLAQRHPGIASDHGFLRVLELGLKPENKAAILDKHHRRIALLNREHGAELDGLWLSSTRWIDQARFPLALPPQPQERAHPPGRVHFL